MFFPFFPPYTEQKSNVYMTKQNHPFHLVSHRPWPFFISIRIFNNLLITIAWIHSTNYYLILTIPCTLLCIFQWWRDIIRESTFQGHHSLPVQKLIRSGIILFIISEIFFFISFFWAYFHSSLSPSIEIGQLWPPYNIHTFNPYEIPLLNTSILITSGLTITWSHHSILNNLFKERSKRLTITIFLGFTFTLLQIYEYIESKFTIADSVYGSSFFISTGFHGLHVIIGTLFLLICLCRLKHLHFSPLHHFNFEAASWYWHFVDVVWLFLYISIYWWRY